MLSSLEEINKKKQSLISKSTFLCFSKSTFVTDCVTLNVQSTLIADVLFFIFDASKWEEKLIIIEMSLYGNLIT